MIMNSTRRKKVKFNNLCDEVVIIDNGVSKGKNLESRAKTWYLKHHGF